MKMGKDFTTLGARLKLSRLLFNISQKDVADFANVSLTVVNKAEQNTYRPPSTALTQIARRLKLNPQWLLFNQSPIFDVRLAFTNLSFEMTKTGFKFRAVVTPEFIDRLIRYLSEIEKSNYGLSINSPQGDETYFVLECSAHYPHYLVLRTDSILYTQVLRATTDNENRPQIFGLDIPSKDHFTEFFSSFGSFYLQPPNETRLLKLTQVAKYLSHLYEFGPSRKGREDKIKYTFATSLIDLSIQDIVSPISIRELSNNIERVLKFVEVIRATPDELKEVIRLMKKRSEGQTK
jgi:transcriptional regulator with XRE-family HTH domain